MKAKSFRAGAAKVDITPPLGTYINGDFVSHYARYIHDQLHAKALVLETEGRFVAIVVVDICVMPKDFLDNVKEEIFKQTGIRAEDVMISSTHTHAAGSVASVYLGAADLQYMKKLPALIVESVLRAKQSIRAAKIAWGSVDVPEHVLCRRYFMSEKYKARNPVTGKLDVVKTNPFDGGDLIGSGTGTTDPEVSFLAIKGLDDEWISLLGNYSLHYVGDWENGTISSDYFGEFSRGIAELLEAGEGFVGMMSNGTSGDINIWDFENPGRYPKEQFAKSKLIGHDIAQRVFDALKHADWDLYPELRSRYEELTLQVRKPSAEDVFEAEKTVSQADYHSFTYNDESLKLLYAREQVLLNDLADTIEFPVQTLSIGRGVIGGLGAEIFAETGLYLKKNANTDHYFTISLANGNAGYAPPAHEFKKGGYETWRSRTSMLHENSEEIIKTAILGQIKDLDPN